jgi:predicted DNA-binding protein
MSELKQKNIDLISIRLPLSLHNRIQERIHQEGKKQSQVIREAMERGFNQPPKKN